MVKHVVCFQLKDASPHKCAEAKALLLTMREKVPQVRQLTVDIDFLHSPRSYDLMLTVLVDDEQALQAYQQDDYHCSVIKPYMHAARTASVAIDALV